MICVCMKVFVPRKGNSYHSSHIMFLDAINDSHGGTMLPKIVRVILKATGSGIAV